MEAQQKTYLNGTMKTSRATETADQKGLREGVAKALVGLVFSFGLEVWQADNPHSISFEGNPRL